MLYIFIAGMSIYIKTSSKYPGIYFPRNSFVTDGTPILVEGNSRYRVFCYSSGASKVSWYYRSGTGSNNKVPYHYQGHTYPYTAYYSTQSRFNQLTRIIDNDPSNKELYCQGNQRTSRFGMFVNPSK